MDDAEDLNALIRELNTGERASRSGETGRLDRWLSTLQERSGSDLLLVAGAPASLRKQGSVTMEESLARLAREGLVDPEEARVRAAHPEEYESAFRGTGETRPA